MVNVILHGCNGRMGKMIAELAREEESLQIVAGVDAVAAEQENSFPVFKSLSDCDVSADVVIDFSNAAAVDALIQACEDQKLALVLCTTGLSAEQLTHVNTLSKMVPVLRSANMSLGINTLMKVLADAAPVLCAAGFDVEVVEKHHRHKLDAPSGTALALADAVNDAVTDKRGAEGGSGANRDKAFSYVYDRSQRRAERASDEIGISAVRGGSIVGEHDVIFAGTDEVVTFSHTAYSRAIFAKGAIAAAAYLAGKQPGLYSMADVVG